MSRLSGMHIYVAGVVATSVLLLAWLVPSVDPYAAVWVIAAGLITEAVATNLRDQVRLSLGNVVVLVATILGGPPLAIVGVLGSAPVFLARATDQRLLRATFNTAQLAISASAAAFVYEVWLGAFSASFPDWIALFGVVLAAVTYGLINVALVSGIIVVTAGEHFLDAFRTIGPSLAMQVPYSGIAVLAAVVISTTPTAAVLLLIVPALVARQGLLAFQHLDDSYDQLVRTIVDTIEMKDRYTRGHSERVAELSVTIAEELGVTYEERRLTRYAALLHDVGKVGVPLCIINKPGRLDDAEFEIMKQHPSIGAQILGDIDFLEPALDIVRYHHERLDGRGYPYGVPGTELSRIVRIVTAADAFDAMTSTRSYRRAMPVEDALAELRRCAGNQFDPDVVEALAVAVERLDWQPLDTPHADGCDTTVQIPLGTAEERIERANTGRPERTPRREQRSGDAGWRLR